MIVFAKQRKKYTILQLLINVNNILVTLFIFKPLQKFAFPFILSASTPSTGGLSSSDMLITTNSQHQLQCKSLIYKFIFMKIIDNNFGELFHFSYSSLIIRLTLGKSFGLRQVITHSALKEYQMKTHPFQFQTKSPRYSKSFTALCINFFFIIIVIVNIHYCCFRFLLPPLKLLETTCFSCKNGLFHFHHQNCLY